MATTSVKTLPLPGIYNPANAHDPNYSPDVNALIDQAEAWKSRCNLTPAPGDNKRVQMLIIDDQYDFSFPVGSLYVAGRSGTGAMDAHKRLVEFSYKYLGIISEIICTMDTHLPHQIFYSSVHLKRDGLNWVPAEPNVLITPDEYRKNYRPRPEFASMLGAAESWLERQMHYYCDQLAASGKHGLFLWPYHCMLGSNGHKLAGVVEEVRLFHSFARGAANHPQTKGGNPLTEHYSIFAPEVMTTWDGQPMAQRNVGLLKVLSDPKVQMVIMAGEASSHCVRESISDFLKYLQAERPDFVKKVYILEDCTAPVVIPGLDYTDVAQEALNKFRDAGMHVVKSTDPIESWPEVRF